jgi:hypothetical protein
MKNKVKIKPLELYELVGKKFKISSKKRLNCLSFYCRPLDANNNDILQQTMEDIISLIYFISLYHFFENSDIFL